MSKRTAEDIVARIEERRGHDVFGFEWPIYLDALPFEAAKPYLKDDVTPADWDGLPKTAEQIRKEAVEYMSFAWDKANNCRGISAGRSLSHYVAWLWLLGDDEVWRTLDDYEFYGKNELRAVCEWLGLDADEWDDGVRVNSESELCALEG